MPDPIGTRRGPVDSIDAQLARQRARWGEDAPVPTTPDPGTTDSSSVRKTSPRQSGGDGGVKLGG